MLTRLAKISDLKVISRTSTMCYASRPDNLLEIAKQLGVVNILEGSVQRIGSAVRINVQLIDATRDRHRWAETYDRDLKDIFALESEVPKAIADQLQVKITGREAIVITEKPTANPEAYDANLRGLTASLRSANSTANSREAQKYLQEAGRLGDPADGAPAPLRPFPPILAIRDSRILSNRLKQRLRRKLNDWPRGRAVRACERKSVKA